MVSAAGAASAIRKRATRGCCRCENLRPAVAESYVALSAVLTILLFSASKTHATAFYLQEQSGRGIGRVNAGAAAAGDDASTIFFNPSEMTKLQAAEVELGVEVVALKGTGRF